MLKRRPNEVILDVFVYRKKEKKKEGGLIRLKLFVATPLVVLGKISRTGPRLGIKLINCPPTCLGPVAHKDERIKPKLSPLLVLSDK